jgi:protein gp37
MTAIEWTDETFNPWWGCTKVSPGCANCYAATFAQRGVGIKGGPVDWGRGTSRRRTSEDVWNAPFGWNQRAEKQGKRLKVFAASMADIFDEEVDPRWRNDFWELVRQCPNLDFQVLTKRPQNITDMLPADWGNGWRNVWLGTSVEDQTRADERIPILSRIPAVVRFLSVEPLLGPVKLDLSNIQWVICGGESGRGARPLEEAWVISVRDQCLARKTPFFFKQWGGRNKKLTGKRLEGKLWRQYPTTEFDLIERRKVVSGAVARYAGKFERLPVDRDLAAELEERATKEGLSRKEYLDRLIRKALFK